MEKVRFIAGDGAMEKLMRPTHAIKVAAAMGGGFSEDVDPGILSAACDAVRDTYRCRDVRKEIRQVREMAANSGAAIHISCRDGDVLEQMREAAASA